MAEIPDRPEYASDLFQQGLAVRKAVLGADYVTQSLEKADDFFAAFQQLTTEVPWGMIWTRPGLARRDRSLIVLAMLVALSKPMELKLHIRGALANGVTRDEIKEVLLQGCIYAGVPAGLEAFKAAMEIFKEIDGAAPG
jgi:4-carboxymuconolactone decarboxylase